MPDRGQEYNSFFIDTYKVFTRVSQYAIILEKYGSGKVLVASINELRSVLFHLYRFVEENENAARLNIDTIEAKEHLNRTYLDLFAKSYAVLIENIHGYQTIYGVDVMISVCPDYYGKMFPGISNMKRYVAEIRASRDLTNTISEQSTIDKNHEIISQLLDWVEQLEGSVLGLKSKLQSDRKKSISTIAISIGSAIVGAIISMILLKIFGSGD